MPSPAGTANKQGGEMYNRKKYVPASFPVVFPQETEKKEVSPAIRKQLDYLFSLRSRCRVYLGDHSRRIGHNLSRSQTYEENIRCYLILGSALANWTVINRAIKAFPERFAIAAEKIAKYYPIDYLSGKEDDITYAKNILSSLRDRLPM
jgi:hypothetical protein